MPIRTHQIVEDVKIIKNCRLIGERWMGANQSFTTMEGFTGTNGIWQKCIPRNTLAEKYRIITIFAYNPSQDDLTRIQVVFGEGAQAEYDNNCYTEALCKFNGSNYIVEEIACPLCTQLDCWIRPVIDNNPTNDATIQFFLSIQGGD